MATKAAEKMIDALTQLMQAFAELQQKIDGAFNWQVNGAGSLLDLSQENKALKRDSCGTSIGH